MGPERFNFNYSIGLDYSKSQPLFHTRSFIADSKVVKLVDLRENFQLAQLDVSIVELARGRISLDISTINLR